MNITETVKTARACGMSYGQYVAQTSVVVVARPKKAEPEPEKKKRRRRGIIATCQQNGMIRQYWSILDAVHDGFLYDGVKKCMDGVHKSHKGWTFERG